MYIRTIYVYINILSGQAPSGNGSIPVVHVQVCLLGTFGLGRQRYSQRVMFVQPLMCPGGKRVDESLNTPKQLHIPHTWNK